MSRLPPWVQQREESWPWRVALCPLAAPAWVYGVGARLHRAWFRPASGRSKTLPIPVLSVGNLTVGGTGKTPTTAWLANALRRRGHRVAIASRGYSAGTRRRRGEVVVVSDGRHVLSRAEVAGDEPMILAGMVPGVPVLVGGDRVAVGLRACSAFDAEVLILDDGFHHHPLHRDVDVVMLDGEFGFGNRKVLPRGPLREPLSALRYANLIGIVDGDLSTLPAADRRTLEALGSGVQHFTATRKPRALRPLAAAVSETPAVLAGVEVGLIAALARPASLRRTLERLGANVVAERTFRDHHRYRSRDLHGLPREVSLWITTEKDAVKITPEWAGGVDIRVLTIELEVEGAAQLLDGLVERLGLGRARCEPVARAGRVGHEGVE